MSKIVGVLLMIIASLLNSLPGHWVMSVMNRLQPAAPWQDTYGESSEAIADAANADPLWEGPDGPMRTAALLLSIAWHESRFFPRAISNDGQTYGLFQIQHSMLPGLTANVLMVPREAAPVAIRYIRTSLRVCGQIPWNRRLGWYASGDPNCERGQRESEPRMLLAAEILEDRAEHAILGEIWKP